MANQALGTPLPRRARRLLWPWSFSPGEDTARAESVLQTPNYQGSREMASNGFQQKQCLLLQPQKLQCFTVIQVEAATSMEDFSSSR